MTDLGYISQLVSEQLRGSTLVLIESNHDRDMLKVGPYPWSVKQRIASNVGHLSNDETARWIRDDFDGQAEYLVWRICRVSVIIQSLRGCPRFKRSISRFVVFPESGGTSEDRAAGSSG